MILNNKFDKLILLIVFVLSFFACSNNSNSEQETGEETTEVYECSVSEYKALHKLLFNKNENKIYTIRITDKNPIDLFSIYNGDILNIILDLSCCTELKELSKFPKERYIKKIILPNTIKNIQYGVLNEYDAQWLEAIEIDNEYYKSYDGIVFTADKKTIISYPASRFATYYEIPESVEKIALKAFYNTNIVTIKFSKAVIIEQKSFNGDYLKYGIFNGTADECYVFLDKLEDNTIKQLDYTLADGSSYKFTGTIKTDVEIYILHNNQYLNNIDSLCLYYYDSELDKNILIAEFTDFSERLLVNTKLETGNYKFIITTKKDNTETQIYQTQLEITPNTTNIVFGNDSSR